MLTSFDDQVTRELLMTNHFLFHTRLGIVVIHFCDHDRMLYVNVSSAITRVQHKYTHT